MSRWAGHINYGIKLEECYYDYKINEYIAVIRFRNKNAIIKKAINNILNDGLIDKLPPYDSYILGAVKIMQDNKFILRNSFFERDIDSYFKIEPLFDFTGIDFTEEALVLKIKSNSFEIKMPIKEVFNNAKFIQAFDAKNAFLIGGMAASLSIQGQF